jgi:putative oxidoreductase
MTIGLLLLRLVLGLTLAAHGAQKLFGWFGGGGLSGTGAHFEKHLGFRPGRVHAFAAGVTESGGGLAIALGFLTPFAAMAVIGVMFVAAMSAHAGKGFFLTKGGFEYTFVLASMAAALAFTGPGRLSVDHALGWDLSGTVWGVVSIAFGCIAGACLMAGRHRLQEAPADPAPAAQVAGAREAGMSRASSREEHAQRPGR